MTKAKKRKKGGKKQNKNNQRRAKQSVHLPSDQAIELVLLERMHYEGSGV